MTDQTTDENDVQKTNIFQENPPQNIKGLRLMFALLCKKLS